MRRIVSFGLVLSLALNVGTATGADDEGIEGKYLIIGIEIGGEKLPDELLKKGKEEERTLKITADTITGFKGGKEDPAAYKIDTCKTPHEIDLTAKKGEGETKLYGIFKVDGDKLTICLVESDKAADRPKEFKTAKDSKAIIMTLQKKKEK